MLQISFPRAGNLDVCGGRSLRRWLVVYQPSTLAASQRGEDIANILELPGIPRLLGVPGRRSFPRRDSVWEMALTAQGVRPGPCFSIGLKFVAGGSARRFVGEGRSGATTRNRGCRVYEWRGRYPRH
jgi:hypothetical protein